MQTRYVSHLEQKAQQGAEQALTNISRYWQNKHEMEKIPAAGIGT